MKTLSQRGVALVITLVMLSIITILVTAYLLLTSREREAVEESVSLAEAEQMASTALERAKAVILLAMQTNFMGSDLAVSVSYPNTEVYDPDVITNLLNDPRVPVFLNTNRPGGSGPLDFRYYIDLNRNGRPETNGVLPVFDDFNRFLGTNELVGDPEWIGMTQIPNQPHSAQNPFIGRYAYLIQPAGRSLDVNCVHNQAKPTVGDVNAPGSGVNGYLRNQGFGPWEMNLAAFLSDLNPNALPGLAGGWSYVNYNTDPMLPSVGTAFDDARAFLNFRYGGRRANLRSFAALFPAGRLAFANDLIDGYSDGPLQPLPPLLAPPAMDNDDPDQPWPGAESTNHFFTVHDFFNTNKVGTFFPQRLAAAGAANSTYNRYTFYRMLAQLGADTGTDREGKINLNYAHGNVGGTRFATTNFVSWDDPRYPELSAAFFVRVADRIFRQQASEFNFTSITNIPIAPTNEYSPAVHRIFQVAANILDATRTSRLPSVFRPLFSIDANGAVFLTNFRNDNTNSTLSAYLANENTNGIPLVIGAKKGLPNFNEYTLRTDIQVTRKLEVVRPDTNSPPSQTNQMYLVGISNVFGLESWNSYSTPYPYPLTLEVRDIAMVTLTNRAGLRYVTNFAFQVGPVLLAAGSWPGGWFLLPLFRQEVVLPNSAYRFNTRSFDPIGINLYERGIGFPLPEWFLTISNRLTYVLSEGDSIVDFVGWHDVGTQLDIDYALMGSNPLIGVDGTFEQDIVAGLWNTNRSGTSPSVFTPTRGILEQLDIALRNKDVTDAIWRNYVEDSYRGQDKFKAQDSFRVFFQQSPYVYATNRVATTNLVVQAPFCPTRKIVKTTTWQANDPLVHYHLGDLLLYGSNSIVEAIVPPKNPVPTNMTLASLGEGNRRYSPWGGNTKLAGGYTFDPNAFNLTIKDPGVRNSEDWDFPNGKFANIGWLGRVHRGTPWQTIYFKPGAANANAWRWQSADYLWSPFWTRTHPTNDWRLADLFTVGLGPTPTRGQLSINQTNLAAWSALFSGVPVLTNNVADQDLALILTNGPIFLDVRFIEPAAKASGLLRLVEGINRFRNALPNGVFTSLSQFLQVPELTIASPFLNTSSTTQLEKGLNDTAYERLPHEVLSLVKVGEPRFVIYSFGQSLKPAPNGVMTRAPYTGLVTNYQVTGEVYTRAVARVDGTTKQNRRVVIESFNILPTE